MTPCLVVGDVHGDLAALRCLLDVTSTPGLRHLFLGDLIGRGEESRAVLEAVLDLRVNTRVDVLMGNHERYLLEYATTGDFLTYALRGGIPVIRSYVGRCFGSVHEEFLAALPFEHRAFLESLPLTLREPGLVAAHARPRRVYEQNVAVVFGHGGGPASTPERRESCLDANPSAGVRLSALLLPEWIRLDVCTSGAGRLQVVQRPQHVPGGTSGTAPP